MTFDMAENLAVNLAAETGRKHYIIDSGNHMYRVSAVYCDCDSPIYKIVHTVTPEDALQRVALLEPPLKKSQKAKGITI